MVNRFGYKEMNCLAHRQEPNPSSFSEYGIDKYIEGDSLNPDAISTDTMLTTADVRVLSAIEDACSEIMFSISCCFDSAYIKTIFDNGGYFPRLRAWCVDVARYRLYDNIRLDSHDGENDHESYRRYSQFKKDIKTLCDCGKLLSDQFAEVPRLYKYVSEVESLSDCIPQDFCCERDCEC